MYEIGNIVETTCYGKCRIVSETLDGRYVIRCEEIIAPNGRFNTVYSGVILQLINK